MDEDSAAFLLAVFHRAAEAVGMLPDPGGDRDRLSASLAAVTAMLGLLHYQPAYAAELAALIVPRAFTDAAPSGFARLAQGMPVSYLKEFTDAAMR